jgi:hypothetical protein
MSRIGVSLLLFCLLGADDKPVPKLPLSKETTFVTGPLDKDGYVDFETALNERLSKGITPEQNANVLLWKALGPKPEGGSGMPPEYFKALGIEEPASQGDYFIGMRAFLGDHRKLPQADWDVIFDQQTRAAQRPWTTQDYPHMAAWLKANEKPLAVVVEATRRPQYFNPMISRRVNQRSTGLLSSLLPNVQKTRELANALAARAMLRVAEGKFDDAWQDLLACHRLGRLVSRGASVIDALVGIALDAVASTADLAYLQHARLSSAEVQDRLKDLQNLPPLAPLADKIDLFERLMCLETLQSIRGAPFGGLEDQPGKKNSPKPDAETMEVLNTLDWGPGLRDTNQWYDRLVSALRIKDRRARNAELAKIDIDLRTMKQKAAEAPKLMQLLLAKGPPNATFGKKMAETLVCLLTPAYNKMQDAYDRAEQTQRNLHVAFALAAFQRDQGHYPAKLEELSPKYLAVVPDDLFSGKPLLYRPSDKGYLLYSVGPNGMDEQGRSRDDDPPGDDPSVRMPLPELKK